jgi:hypothetical protein
LNFTESIPSEDLKEIEDNANKDKIFVLIEKFEEKSNNNKF